MSRPYDPWKCRSCGALKSEGCGAARLAGHRRGAACPLDLRFWWDRLLFRLLGIVP